MSLMDDIFKKLNDNQFDNLSDKLKDGFNVFKEGINNISEEYKKTIKNEEDKKEEMSLDEYFSDDEYVNSNNESVDYKSVIGDISDINYDELKKKIFERFSENNNTKSSSLSDLLELLKKYEQASHVEGVYSNIKNKIKEIKELYDNYKSLDEEDQKRIAEDNRNIKKEKMIELKKNFLLALDLFNDLNKETEEYFKTCDQSIIDEINKKANEKNKKEEKKDLVKELFESFSNRVNATLFVFKNVYDDLQEVEMQKLCNELLKQYDKVLEVYNTLNYNKKLKYYEEVNETCQRFYELIKIYNTTAYGPISIIGEPIEMIDEKDKIYLKNTKMAITSNNKLDLFKIYNYNEYAPLYGRFNSLSYNEGVLYIGLTTDEVALNKKHIGIAEVDEWASDKASIVYGYKRYDVTSEGLKPSADFERLRKKMYEDKKQIIPYYGEGVTTLKEVNEVINYGSYLYELDNKSNKVK